VKAADTSLIVAAFASWHEHHDAARRVLDAGVRLIDQCALETYSVLTRLPAPHRSPGVVVRDFLRARFRPPFLRLGTAGYRAFVLALADRGVTGGSAYDALVAATAAASGAELVTCDRRAAGMYESYGVPFRLIS
jgi:predicted nucleic acid-binding protein